MRDLFKNMTEDLTVIFIGFYTYHDPLNNL